MNSKKYSLNEGKEREKEEKRGLPTRVLMSPLSVRPPSSRCGWHTPAVRACCLGTLTQQVLEHLLQTDAHIQLQMHVQLLFQEGRLILKYSLITFNSAEN